MEALTLGLGLSLNPSFDPRSVLWQELCDVLAHCLMTNPADRPSAAHLLRHRFFAKRAARDAPALVSALLLRLPAQVQPNDISVLR